MLQPVPTLDDILRDPHVLIGLPAETLAAIAMRIAAIQSAIAAAQCTLPANATTEQSGQQDELLTVEQAASILSVSAEWVYKRAQRLGLAVRLAPGTLRISRSKLDAFMRSQAVTSTGVMRRKRALDR